MALGAKLYFFEQISRLVFYQYFSDFFDFFMVLIKIRKLFSLKIKSSEIQKCVYTLFLLKSKILQRLNHRITLNLQNCNKKSCNFQFWCNFYGKLGSFFLVYSKVINIRCSVETRRAIEKQILHTKKYNFAPETTIHTFFTLLVRKIVRI